MLYYTQLIFIKKGMEETFHTFEDHVLPLLERHNGKLLYRVRPAEKAVIETRLDFPYELHLVCFQARNDFESYRDDKDGLK
jgi:hypothetical protein